MPETSFPGDVLDSPSLVQGPTSPGSRASAEPDYYHTKRIIFLGKTRTILLQNENGPCPLLSLCNVLILRNELELPLVPCPLDSRYALGSGSPSGTQDGKPSREWVVKSKDLVEMLGNRIIEFNSRNLDDPVRAKDYELNIQEVIANVLPRLHVGLDVNCRFTSPTGFEYTPELDVFDLLDVTLVHGWLLPNPRSDIYSAYCLQCPVAKHKSYHSQHGDSGGRGDYDALLYSVVSPLSYNQLVERYVAYKELVARLGDSSEKAARDTPPMSGTDVVVDQGLALESTSGSAAVTEQAKESSGSYQVTKESDGGDVPETANLMDDTLGKNVTCGSGDKRQDAALQDLIELAEAEVSELPPLDNACEASLLEGSGSVSQVGGEPLTEEEVKDGDLAASVPAIIVREEFGNEDVLGSTTGGVSHDDSAESQAAGECSNSGGQNLDGMPSHDSVDRPEEAQSSSSIGGPTEQGEPPVEGSVGVGSVPDTAVTGPATAVLTSTTDHSAEVPIDLLTPDSDEHRVSLEAPQRPDAQPEGVEGTANAASVGDVSNTEPTTSKPDTNAGQADSSLDGLSGSCRVDGSSSQDIDSGEPNEKDDSALGGTEAADARPAKPSESSGCRNRSHHPSRSGSYGRSRGPSLSVESFGSQDALDAVLLHEGPLIAEFLDCTSSQLTEWGLLELTRCLKDHQLAILFRNNHFSTVFKHQNSLYLLATDIGFAGIPEVVWERFDRLDGDTHYCDDVFETLVDREKKKAHPAERAATGPSATVAAHHVSPPVVRKSREQADYEYAVSLQQQENTQWREQPATQPRGRGATQPPQLIGRGTQWAPQTHTRTATGSAGDGRYNRAYGEQQHSEDPRRRRKKERCTIS